MSVLSLSSLTLEPKACKHSSTDKYNTMFITKANNNTGECVCMYDHTSPDVRCFLLLKATGPAGPNEGSVSKTHGQSQAHMGGASASDIILNQSGDVSLGGWAGDEPLSGTV